MRADPAAREDFATEVSVLSALAGRGAPRLLAHGEDGPGPWLVMEHRALPSLATRMAGWATEPTADPTSFVSRLLPVALRVLSTVHDAADDGGPLGIVHGDLSPDTVLVADDASECLLVDFALARFRGSRAAASGVFRGSALYASPEVARGEPATGASDVFSLGLTLLHAANARSAGLPREGRTLAALIASAGTDSVLPYAEHAARDLPAHDRAMLLRCVAFAPDARPTAAALGA